ARSYKGPVAPWDSELSRTLRSADPRSITSRKEMMLFHDAMIEFGRHQQKAIGPHGTLLPGLLLLEGVGTQDYVTDRSQTNPERPDCACNNCINHDVACSQYVDNEGFILLFGVCIMCWIH